MKKILALIMALVMILVSTTAFATTAVVETTSNTAVPYGEGAGWDGIDPGILDKQPAVVPALTSSLIASTDVDRVQVTSNIGKISTELWMQVDATGQIDVTVPLTLVFRTNIDGGSASTAPKSYKLTNYSSADLKVTQVAFYKQEESSNSTNKMTLAGRWGRSFVDEERDFYVAQIKVDDGGNAGKMKNFDFHTTNSPTTPDLYATYSMTQANNYGLIHLPRYKGVTVGAGEDTYLTAMISTSRLDFVTTQSTAGGADTSKGIQLAYVEYTIAINDGNAVSTGDIPTGNHLTNQI